MKQQLDGTEMGASRSYQVAFVAMLLALTLVLLGGPGAAAAQSGASIEDVGLDDADISVEPIEPLPAEELAELVGRVALYPDDLLSIVLAASTYPLQVVQASRFLQEREQDPDLKPDEEWDDSVVALLNYPEALALLNDDLDWTWKLGQAVLVQQEDVLGAVGDFRERARVAGNLESDERQVVEVVDDGAIEIKPADPEVIYVPYYEPSRVTVYSDYPVYHYYPRAYPVYYYPYPADYRFSAGYFWGVTSAFSIGWSSHRLHMHHHSFYGHPYYGRTYYDRYYYRRPHLSLTYNYYRNHHNYRHSTRRHHAGNYWRPHARHHGSSPRFAYQSGNRWAYRRHDGKHRSDRHDRNDDRRHDRNDHRRHDRNDGRRRETYGGHDRRDARRQGAVARDRGGDTTQRARPRHDVARDTTGGRLRADGDRGARRQQQDGHREQRHQRIAPSPQRGTKLPTPARQARDRAEARTANAPARNRQVRDPRRDIAQGRTVTRGQALRPAQQARSAPPQVQRARVERSRAQPRAPKQVRRAPPPQGQRQATKRARSAPAEVARGGSMQARAQRQANAYLSRSAPAKARAPRTHRAAQASAPKASAPRTHRGPKAQGSGHRGGHARQAPGSRAGNRAGNRSGKRMGLRSN